MKILAIHADFIEFEAKKKAFKQAEQDISKEPCKIEECLVIFTAVEKGDEADPAAVVVKYVQEIKNIAQQLAVKNVVVYPYAHLSPNLSSPKVAEQVMKDAEAALKDKFTVSRAPFGWYKSFNIQTKGHPMSELSRSIAPDEPRTADLSREFKDHLFVYDERELSKEEKLHLSAAFIMARAVKHLFPDAKVGQLHLHNGQAFADFQGIKLHNQDLKRIEKQMKKVIHTDSSFEEASKEDLGPLQHDILKDVGQEKGKFLLDGLAVVPLHNQPFVKSATDVRAFKVLHLGGGYWKSNENNEQLVRVYCVGFASLERLEEYEKKQQDAENRSHLKIGREQELFVSSDLVGPGLPLLAPRGAIIRHEIENFLWQLHKNEGYERVWTPHIAKKALYQTSGHWDKFGDELFHVKGKFDDFVMKPMNCPHHMQIFDSFSLSYRQLPIRFFEPATIYRDEKSGQLIGLARVRSITQDDGHLFCRVSQITEEAKKIVDIIHQFYKVMGMEDYWVSLSVRGEDKSKYLGTDEAWKIAEGALEKAAQEKDLPYKKQEGEAAFYGPKLDFMLKDALGREWQLATIQCDFNLPERFDLSFMNEKSLKERPVVIHRAISGSLERFMSVLIEHFAGRFPLWLSPVQVKLVTITDRDTSFAKEVEKKMRVLDIRVELDDRAESMGRKVRDAQLEQVNYIVTIGDKESENKTLAIRKRDGSQEHDVKVDDFITRLVDEIEGKVIK